MDASSPGRISEMRTGRFPAGSARAWDNEFAAILACCRADAESCEIGASALSRIDWDRFLASAEVHGVSALVCSGLKRSSWRGSVPPAVTHRLSTCSLQIAKKSLYLSARLLAIVERLQSKRIAALPFKGPALALRAYGDLTLRDSCDLDLLIKAEDLEQAVATLVEAGFQLPCPLTARRYQWLRKYEFELGLVGPDGLRLELHWEALPHYFGIRLCSAGVWDRTTYTSIAGAAVQELSAEDLLLFLSLHAGKHFWDRLVWLCDIDRLLRKKASLDWEYLRESSRKLHIERFLSTTLYLVRELFGTELPEQVLRKIAGDHSIPQFAQQVLKGMNDLMPAQGTSVVSYLRLLRLRERWRDRISQAVTHACTPGLAEWTQASLPSAFYFPLHVFRLGATALKSLRE